VEGAEGVVLARWRRHPAGVDAVDADEVEESRHLGVVAFAGDWPLLAGEGLLVVADGELFNEALPDEGAPRYQAGTESLSMEARTRCW